MPVTSVARTLADLATSLERLPAVWAAVLAASRRGSGWTGQTGGGGVDHRDGGTPGVARLRGAAADPAVQARAPDGTLVARLDDASLREKGVLEYDGLE
jgi:hypothetical protein